MKLLVDYIERSTLTELKEEVQNRLDTGWKLSGGAQKTATGFLQTLQREDGYNGPTQPIR